MPCAICLRAVRLKFKTGRISICARCVKTLNATQLSAREAERRWLSKFREGLLFHNPDAEWVDGWVEKNAVRIMEERLKDATHVGRSRELKILRAYRRRLICWDRRYLNYPENWNFIRLQVKHWHNYACYVCGARESDGARLHAHHIVFRSNSGRNSYRNLVVLCFDHHQAEHDHPIGLHGGEPAGSDIDEAREEPIRARGEPTPALVDNAGGYFKVAQEQLSAPVGPVGVAPEPASVASVHMPEIDDEACPPRARVELIPHQAGAPEAPPVLAAVAPAAPAASVKANSWWLQIAWLVALVLIRGSSNGVVDDIGKVFTYAAAPALAFWLLALMNGWKDIWRGSVNIALVGATLAVLSGVAARQLVPTTRTAAPENTPSEGQNPFAKYEPPPAPSPPIQPNEDEFGKLAEILIAMPGNSDLTEPGRRKDFQDAVDRVDRATGGKLSNWDVLVEAREQMLANDPQARANSDYEKAYAEIISAYPKIATDQQLQDEILALRDELVANGRPGDLALRDAVHRIVTMGEGDRARVPTPETQAVQPSIMVSLGDGGPPVLVNNPSEKLVNDVRRQQSTASNQIASHDNQGAIAHCNQEWELALAAIPEGIPLERSANLAKAYAADRERCYEAARAAQ